jgi:decaprenylphospho-beta-D-ribofuranose 2-oxidase
LETFFPIQKKMIYYYLFGNRGVIENQWLFSHEQWKNFLNDFLKLCDSSKNPLTLVSTKLFNGESQYLRFDGTGICLAINTPNTVEGLKFSKSMDELGLKFKGIPNIIKDIRIQHDVIEKAYGSEYLRFKNELNDVIPESKIRSSLSDRLHL